MMRAALAGDEAAYKILLGELAGALRVTVRAALRRLGKGDADSEDIVQEALIAIHLKRANWDPALPLAPWINAVARYKVIDALRRQGFRAHVSVDDLADILPAQEKAEESRSDIERLVGRLGERAQRIVRAVSMEGRASSEVANELGMSEGAVRVALHRALKELAALYRGGAR